MSAPARRLRMLDAWTSYEAAVIPLGAPAVQIQESRRAFYSGAWSLLCLIMGQVSAGDEVTEADEQMMTELDAELRAFTADVMAGRK